MCSFPVEQRTYRPTHNALPEIGEDAGKVLDDVCREMVDQGFHVPSANYFGLMNPDANLYRSAGRSAGGRAQSATRYRGAIAVGVED